MVVPVGLFPPVSVFIVHNYQLVRYFDVGRPRAISTAGGSVGEQFRRAWTLVLVRFKYKYTKGPRMTPVN